MIRKGIYLLLFVLAQIAFAHEENVHTVRYPEGTLAKKIVKKNEFVMFYAPWCSHSKSFKPIWKQLAKTLYENGDSRVHIAKVDCTTHKSLCSDQNITDYPTLKFFRVGERKGTTFRGTPDIPTLISFIDEQLHYTITLDDK